MECYALRESNSYMRLGRSVDCQNGRNSRLNGFSGCGSLQVGACLVVWRDGQSFVSIDSRQIGIEACHNHDRMWSELKLSL